jgi:NADPH-dependent 2,4-dienoyl-CoA reductase/sulfur reductase-like enzyme
MEYLVIGAGPAGPQLSYLLARRGHDFRIVEAGERPGSFFTSFPRHRRLISINKAQWARSYNMRTFGVDSGTGVAKRAFR